MYTKLFLTSFIVAALTHSVFTQQPVQVGLLPALSFTKKNNELWQYNIKLESRQWLLQQENDRRSDFRYEYVLTDLSLLISRKIRLQNTLSAGYLHRREINRSTHRFIQQYLILKKYDRFRLAHRVVTDQTAEGREWTLRARYRITAEWALQGNIIDKQEWYLKINHEYLNALTNGKYNLEMRIVPLLGYVFKNNQKLEAGIDYRRSLLLQNPRQVLWGSVTYYMNQ